MPNYRAIARRKARKYGLNPGVFERQIQQESGFQPRISSSAGAQGIAQIMPATARGWGVNPNKPRQALDAAAKNMASYVRKYGGYENALRAYNAGPGAIQKSKGYSETNHYVKTILGGKDPGKLSKARRGGTAGTAGTAGLTRITKTRTPGVSNKAARGQLIAQFLQDKGSDPLEFALGIKGLKDIPGSTRTQRSHRPGTPGTPGTRGGGGGQPRKTGGQIHELFWNGPGATNIDNGKRVGKGFVSGHTDHVHFAADKSKMRNAARLAKQLGLNVGEYGKGISSGHATGSFHYQPYGAMDVSGDTAKMRKFAQRAARL